jgi:hypothetical protein
VSKPFNRGRNTNDWNARTDNFYPRTIAVTNCKCPLCAWINKKNVVTPNKPKSDECNHPVTKETK